MIPEPASISNGPIDIQDYNRILGIDESGKGDFFGPLVIAGVLADRNQVKAMVAHGVRDSKKISDGKIVELAAWISGSFVHSVVIIGPEKYNQLYEQIRNLNRLLAWGHSRVIENIAQENPFDLAVSDQFGHPDFIIRALMEKGRNIRLHQAVRAESIPQVAAASILARAGFVRYMSKLSFEYQMKLPKGAGNLVDEAAAKLVKDRGQAILQKVAKIHFKNYRKAVV